MAQPLSSLFQSSSRILQFSFPRNTQFPLNVRAIEHVPPERGGWRTPHSLTASLLRAPLAIGRAELSHTFEIEAFSMVDFLVRNQVELLRVQWGDEHQIANPEYLQLANLLDFVCEGSDLNHCVDCRALLPGDIEVHLHLMRVNDLDRGEFLGWLVQISSITDFEAFLLADTSFVREGAFASFTQVELLGCCEFVSTRCILPHAELLEWLRQQLSPGGISSRYRWIDIALALGGD